MVYWQRLLNNTFKKPTSPLLPLAPPLFFRILEAQG